MNAAGRVRTPPAMSSPAPNSMSPASPISDRRGTVPPPHTTKQAHQFLRAMTGIEQRPDDAQQGIEIRGSRGDDPFHAWLLVLPEALHSPGHGPSGDGRGGPSDSMALLKQGLLAQHRVLMSWPRLLSRL